MFIRFDQVYSSRYSLRIIQQCSPDKFWANNSDHRISSIQSTFNLIICHRFFWHFLLLRSRIRLIGLIVEEDKVSDVHKLLPHPLWHACLFTRFVHPEQNIMQKFIVTKSHENQIIISLNCRHTATHNGPVRPVGHREHGPRKMHFRTWIIAPFISCI